MTGSKFVPADLRIRGRAGQGEEDNKWYFEISFTNFDATKSVGEPMTYGPFDTEQQAEAFGTEAVKVAASSISDHYLDMKNNQQLSTWKSQ